MADWGALSKPMTDGRRIGEEGDVVQFNEHGASHSPRHDVHYDATDSRHNLETGNRPWTSVDDRSGPMSDTDWESTRHFPDGPGAWRQT